MGLCATGQLRDCARLVLIGDPTSAGGSTGLLTGCTGLLSDSVEAAASTATSVVTAAAATSDAVTFVALARDFERGGGPVELFKEPVNVDLLGGSAGAGWVGTAAFSGSR